MSKHSRTRNESRQGKQRKKRANHYQPHRLLSLESLENRVLMAGLTSTAVSALAVPASEFASSSAPAAMDAAYQDTVDESPYEEMLRKTLGIMNFLPSTNGPDTCRIDIDPDDSDYVRFTYTIGNAGPTTFSVRGMFLKSIEYRGEDGDDVFENNTRYRSLVWGGGGKDIILGGSGNDELHGGEHFADLHRPDDGIDLIEGRGGDDKIWGDDDNDDLSGGDGEDKIFGGHGDDEMSGGDDDDEVRGEDGADKIDGGSGDDQLFGGAGGDEIHGGTGDDLLDSGDSTRPRAPRNELYGEPGQDTLIGRKPQRGDPGDLLDWGLLPVFQFKQTQVSVDEGNTATLTIERVPRDADLITSKVNFQMNNATTSPSDFSPPGGLTSDNGDWDLVFRPGEPKKTLSWSPARDGLVEKDEHFTVTLTEADRAVVDSSADTVTVTVYDENHAPSALNDDGGKVAAGKTVTIDVLKNDKDPDGDPISIVSTSKGKLSSDRRSIIYTAPNKTGDDSFTYTIQDDRGGADKATVTVTVTNKSPIAWDDGPMSVAVGNRIKIDVLANDEDPDGQPIVITGTSDARAKVTEDGKSIVFTAPGKTDDNYPFRYTIRDIAGATATATVTVKVTNDAPIAVKDDATTRRDEPVDIRVLDNDSDPDGHVPQIVGFSQGAHGRVTDFGGILQYTPDMNYFNYGVRDSDWFTYTISDGYGLPATARVDVEIRRNLEPVAVDDWAIVQINRSAEIDVLKNDFDPDPEDPLTVTSVGKPQHGSVSTKTSNGKTLLVYKPAQNYFGKDQFSYKVSDGHGGSDEAVVKIDVNRPPVAQPDRISTPHNKPVKISVLDNDSDPDGDPLQLVRCTNASARGGDVSLEGSMVVYKPPKDFVGSDQLQYTVSDGRGGEATTVVDITVTNAAPVTQADSASTQKDEAVEIPVLRNDTDPDGDELSVKTFDRQTAHGTVARKGPNRPNVLIYIPKAGFVGTDKFSYTAADGFGGTANGVVTVTVVNRGPVAQVDEVTVTAGQSIEIAVLANDSDPDGDALSVESFTTASAHGGEVKRKGPNRPNVLIYTPRPGFVGTDQLQYTISDGRGGTATTVVNIVVRLASANNRGGVSQTAGTTGALLTDQVLAMTADWQPSSYELDRAIRLISREPGDRGKA